MWIFENGQYAADLVYFYESNSIEKKREFGRTRCKVFIFKTSHAGTLKLNIFLKICKYLPIMYFKEQSQKENSQYKNFKYFGQTKQIFVVTFSLFLDSNL